MNIIGLVLYISSFWASAQSLELGCPQFVAGTYLCTQEQTSEVRTLSITQDHIDGVNSYTFSISGEQVDEVRCDKSKTTTYVCNDTHRARSELDKFYCDKIMQNIEYQNITWSELKSKSIKVNSKLSKRLFGSKIDFLKTVIQQKSFAIITPDELEYSHKVENLEKKSVSNKNYKCLLRKKL